MQNYTIKISNRKNKKYMIITPDGKYIHFASPNHENFTTHNDPKRK
jgi:hypothetical protein